MSLAAESLTLRVQAEQIADAYTPNGGRAPVITDPDKVQLFLAALADGNYREVALKIAGIAKQTYYNTLKRADAGDLQASAFIDACEKAEAQAESEMVRNVRVASKLPQYWAAAATHLERKHPDRWGRRQDDQSAPKVIVQIGARDSDVQVNVTTTSLSPESYNDLPTISTGQVEILGLINGDSVNQLRQPVVASDQVIAALDPPGDPTPCPAPSSVRKESSGKGHSGGRQRKKGQT